jgi:hypothetical protein
MIPKLLKQQQTYCHITYITNSIVQSFFSYWRSRYIFYSWKRIYHCVKEIFNSSHTFIDYLSNIYFNILLKWTSRTDDVGCNTYSFVSSCALFVPYTHCSRYDYTSKYWIFPRRDFVRVYYFTLRGRWRAYNIALLSTVVHQVQIRVKNTPSLRYEHLSVNDQENSRCFVLSAKRNP